MLLGAVAALGAAVFWVVHGSLIDDSYITLSYARNLAFEGHWGLIPHSTANTATSPLNVLLLAGLTVVLRSPVVALGVLFVVANGVLAAALLRTTRTLRLPRWAAQAAWALVLANPLVLSTVGLEAPLAAALLAVSLAAAAENRAWAFGICAGLLLLTRFDLVIFAVVLFTISRGLWRRWWKCGLAAVATGLPWFAFSWVVLGSLVPDTLILKTTQRSWGSYQFGNGLLLYLHAYPAATALALLPALLGGLTVLAWGITRLRGGSPVLRRALPVAGLGLAAAVHYAAYSQLGVPPYHWYYAPAVIALSICLGLLAPTLRAGVVGRFVAAGGLVVLLLGEAGFDVGRGVPWKQPPITTNWATPAQYAAIGHALAARVGNQAVRGAGEIGAIAYFCDCAIVDGFSDRGSVLPEINRTIAEAGPVTRWLWALNFHFLDRTQPPLHTSYALRHTAHKPATGPSWPATTPWHGPGAPAPGYYTLHRETTPRR